MDLESCNFQIEDQGSIRTLCMAVGGSYEVVGLVLDSPNYFGKVVNIYTQEEHADGAISDEDNLWVLGLRGGTFLEGCSLDAGNRFSVHSGRSHS